MEEFILKTKRIIKKLDKKQERLLHKQSLSGPIQKKIRTHVPDKAMQALETAFEKSFVVIFQKGTPWIEKATHIKDKQELAQYFRSSFDCEQNKQKLKRFDQNARKTSYQYAAITQVKSSVLGLFGIGIPDIPLYLTTLLSGIYQIETIYGYDIHEEKEQAYVLLLICAMCDEEEKREEWKNMMDAMEDGRKIKYSISELITYASHALAYSELQAKFLQGIPIAGIAGAFMSTSMQNRILTFARTSYKRRMLHNR